VWTKSFPLNNSGKCVRKTIADIEPGAVPSAAKAAKRLDRDLGVLRGQCHDFDVAVDQCTLQVGAAGLTIPAFDDE